MFEHQGTSATNPHPRPNGGVFIATPILRDLLRPFQRNAAGKTTPDIEDADERRQQGSVVVSWLLPGFIIIGLAVVVGPVFAFTIDEALNNATPADRTDDLSDAARWSNLQGSLVTHNVRGLGGGLEYAIASDFCTTLIPQIVDNPSCNELKDAIQETLDLWSEGHPFLYFVDKTNAVAAKLPPAGSAALSRRGCNHFSSILLHEVGHALGLDHPNEYRGRNFRRRSADTLIDCDSPESAFVLSNRINRQAVMNTSRGRSQPVRTKLTDDDIDGRDFLYPTCESTASDRG